MLLAASVADDSTRFLLPHHATQPTVVGRERELQLLAFQTQGTLEYANQSRTLLTGPPGSGKTMVATTMLQRIQDEATTKRRPNIYPIYIDLGTSTTTAKVWHRICKAITPLLPPHRKGMSAGEYADLACDAIAGEPAQLVLVLDELEKHAAENEMFHWLTRFNHPNIQISLILISNDPDFALRLRPELQSSLGRPTHIPFAPYQQPTLIGILEQYAKTTLQPDALQPDVIPYLAAKATQAGGDARNALDTLRAAIRNALLDSDATSITLHHAQTGYQTAGHDFVSTYVRQLGVQKKVALASLLSLSLKAGSEWTTTMDAYRVYSQHVATHPVAAPVTFRTFFTFLDSLGRTERILDTVIRNRGRAGGVQRSYKLAANMPVLAVWKALRDDPYTCDLLAATKQPEPSVGEP